MGRKKLDLIGERFGRLEVISFYDVKDSNSRWVCKCDCGNETVVEGHRLKRGTTSSCGCLQKELTSAMSTKYADRELAPVVYMYNSYLRRSVVKKIEFLLSFDEFNRIINEPCHYCGDTGAFKKYGRGITNTLVNGIDRLDSQKGYVLDNCVPCCSKCNYAKKQLLEMEFLSWIDKVYTYQHSKEIENVT